MLAKYIVTPLLQQDRCERFFEVFLLSILKLTYIHFYTVQKELPDILLGALCSIHGSVETNWHLTMKTKSADPPLASCAFHK